ncbi:MAG: hypothetical protein WC919_03430 [Candidatus Paceibacterota bacterium]|jgi:hypothetical protein
MLDPQTIKFDKYNVWAKVWYIPTSSELYITDYDGNVVAKYYHIYRKGEWPMWIFKCIANVADVKHKAAIDSIVHAWETRVTDLVDTNIQSQRRRSAILDE